MPDFLIIGATKGGTTSLHSYLLGHPGIYMHPKKELRYFTAEHNLHRGLDWYRACFRAAAEAEVAGEASNAYTRDPVYRGVASRIAATVPGVRLIYLIRDPMQRLESHYRHRLVTAREWRGADEAVARDPGYVAASLYGHQLRQYLDHVPRQRVLVLRSERLFADPVPALDELCAFLGVTRDASLPFRPENAAAGRRVAPRLVRDLGRFARRREGTSRLARLVQGTPLGRAAPTADRPEFRLSDKRRSELIEAFRADGRLLADLAGADIADWSTAPLRASAEG